MNRKVKIEDVVTKERLIETWESVLKKPDGCDIDIGTLKCLHAILLMQEKILETNSEILAEMKKSNAPRKSRIPIQTKR